MTSQIIQSIPLFTLILLGYGLIRWAHWSRSISEALSRFVFSLALPVFLFHTMSDFSKLPPVDARLLIAFFGGGFIVFILARLLVWKLFHLDGVAQSVVGLGAIFCNNAMLGLPLTQLIIGNKGLPAASLVIVFHALILWTLVTVSVEWALHGNFSVKGFSKTAKSVITNPIVVGILGGTLWSMTGLTLPVSINSTLGMVGNTAVPTALIALGMGLAEYGVGKDWRLPLTIAALKLLIHPLAVWGLALALGLPALETQVVVLMASIATGVNVYLMARQFNSMEGPIAASLVISTALSAISSPLLIALLKHF